MSESIDPPPTTPEAETTRVTVTELDGLYLAYDLERGKVFELSPEVAADIGHLPARVALGLPLEAPADTPNQTFPVPTVRLSETDPNVRLVADEVPRLVHDDEFGPFWDASGYAYETGHS